MSRSVDDLRNELRNLGYLSHGLERWFARDPWKSGTFWTELMIVASKASLVIALFASAAATTVMSIRNGGLPLLETSILAALYFASSFLTAITGLILVALVLKARPVFGVENPRALMLIAMAMSAVFVVLLVSWWTAFPSEPSLTETATFAILLILLFLASSILISAALLSFSIHESKEIPRIHRRPRTLPLSVGAIVLLAMILWRSWMAAPAETLVEAPQIVVRPSEARVVLIAVDGLTPEIFTLRPELRERMSAVATLDGPRGTSAPEIWASLGTGTPPSLHGVRSIEGIRLFGGSRVIQHVSPLDIELLVIAPALGLAERQPLPPSVRDRHFIWEALAERGVPAVAVNWWTTESERRGGLRTVSQEEVFSSAGELGPAELAVAIDGRAIAVLQDLLRSGEFRFATIYLPALDVVLNRIEVTERERLSSTIQSLDQLQALAGELASMGWSLLLIGTPGDAEGDALLATTLPLPLDDAGVEDLAPTILALYGFPPSQEMAGESLVPAPDRITSYGSRESTDRPRVNDDYYENLKSLGYIQ